MECLDRNSIVGEIAINIVPREHLLHALPEFVGIAVNSGRSASSRGILRKEFERRFTINASIYLRFSRNLLSFRSGRARHESLQKSNSIDFNNKELRRAWRGIIHVAGRARECLQRAARYVLFSFHWKRVTGHTRVPRSR